MYCPFNMKTMPYSVPALYTGLEVCPEKQHESEEQSCVAHKPHSSL